jgi:penicillin-binding protein 1A
MNGGYKATPHVIRRVTTADGSKVLYENTYDNPPRVLSEAIAANMNTMMMGVINQGTGKSAKLSGWQAAGKTGTTQNSRDALFVGFTSNLTTGVWFGNDDGKPMKKVTGGGLPAKAWQEFMVAAHKGLSPAPLFGNGQFMADPAANPGFGDQPMASAEPGMAPPLEEPTTIGSILSGVFGESAERYPQANDRPRRQPIAPVNGGPVPPADIADDGGYGYGDALPPGDIGEPEPSPAHHRKRTTLLDLIMGQ